MGFINEWGTFQEEGTDCMAASVFFGWGGGAASHMIYDKKGMIGGTSSSHELRVGLEGCLALRVGTLPPKWCGGLGASLHGLYGRRLVATARHGSRRPLACGAFTRSYLHREGQS